MMYFLAQLAADVPVPRDIPLALPAAAVLLKVLLIASFLLHILFVNLMVGGVTLTLVFELMGLKKPAYDSLARALAATITVNKSLAVVLGVAPLLVINVLYTVWFYTANSITGRAWISVVPLVTIAFLLTYLHKYTWDRLPGKSRKWLHIAILVPAAILFWFIPFIFLSNINLMLFPQHWRTVGGFVDAVMLSNVLPRYLHFMFASIALVSLFGVWWFGSASAAAFAGEHPVAFTPPQLKRKFYLIALIATVGQLGIGPLVYFTLPVEGLTIPMTIIIFTGASIAIIAMFVMASEVRQSDARIGRRLGVVIVLLTGTVICMGTGRHLYREGALAEHRQLVAAKTAAWEADARLAQVRQQNRQRLLAAGPVGQTVYDSTCSSCHAVDRVRVGPSLREIASLYRDNPDGIVTWTQNPGKKRANTQQMPAFKLDPKTLRKVADHMITLGAPEPTTTP